MAIKVTDFARDIAVNNGAFYDTVRTERNVWTDKKCQDSYVPNVLQDEIVYSNYTSRGINDSVAVIINDDQYLVRIRHSLFEKFKSFYKGDMDEDELDNYIRNTTREYLKATSGDLSRLYCVFQRSNVEAGVSANYDEAEKF